MWCFSKRKRLNSFWLIAAACVIFAAIQLYVKNHRSSKVRSRIIHDPNLDKHDTDSASVQRYLKHITNQPEHHRLDVVPRDRLNMESVSVQRYLQHQSGQPGRHRLEAAPRDCSAPLGPTPVHDLAKISSYRFEGIEKYTDELFTPMRREPDPPQHPVFVTAMSSNHFREGVTLVRNLKKTVWQKYKDLKLILYDIGLAANEIRSLQNLCSCEIRKFPFDRYPRHVSSLGNYTWKPVIIQTVAKEYPFLFWMDASVRFRTCDLDNLFEAVKTRGLMVGDLGRRLYETVSERTHNATFNFLQEHPCTFSHQCEKQGTMILIFANQMITTYFLRPWVSCALTFGCMDPVSGSKQLLECPRNIRAYRYHLCHRFDQSVLGILFTRLFHRRQTEHSIHPKYIAFIKSPDDIKSKCDLHVKQN